MHPADSIYQYFPDLNLRQKEQFGKMGELYKSWNQKINVISRKDINHLYVRHILHSLAIANVIAFKPGTKIMDAGTGGGFPGIPLAILFPEVQFHLTDSIGKKITVVREIASSLNLSNVKPMQIRAEMVNDTYDFIISRAVTRMKTFYHWVHNKVKSHSAHSLENGILYLKGGDVDEEMNEFGQLYRVFDITAFYDEPWFETKKVIFVPCSY